MRRGREDDFRRETPSIPLHRNAEEFDGRCAPSISSATTACPLRPLRCSVPSHCLTVSLSHCRTVSLSHCLTVSLSHCLTVSLSHFLTVSLCSSFSQSRRSPLAPCSVGRGHACATGRVGAGGRRSPSPCSRRPRRPGGARR